MLCDNLWLIIYRAELFKLLYKHFPQLNKYPLHINYSKILQAFELNISFDLSKFCWQSILADCLKY